MERVKLVNLFDEFMAKRGMIPLEAVRQAEVEGLVDTGATMLVLPTDLVERLGLETVDERRVRYADGRAAMKRIVGAIRVEILGRSSEFDAVEEAPGTMPLIGQVVLEVLDLIVDPKKGVLKHDPDSANGPTYDLF